MERVANADAGTHYLVGGFTLVELLVVMAIIAVLAAASVTAFRSVSSALGLSTAGQVVASEITTARQTALTFSEEVEVRFYFYPDPVTGASQFNAVQSFSTTDGTNFTQVDRMSYMPASIMIAVSPGGSSTATALSYPFADNGNGTTSTPPSSTVNPTYQVTASGTASATINGSLTTINGVQTIPGTVGLTYYYKVLRFKPGGSVDYVIPSTPLTGWPPSSWYVTLVEKKYANSTTASVIKNYLTINVDSTDGRVRTFQP